jgi:GT2 family glycosyltransferase
LRHSPVDLTIALVHYHTPELASAAVSNLLSAAREDSIALELVIVDNGSDERGARELRSSASAANARVLAPSRNLGYAGGANLGLREARGAALGVMNADVVVRPGCLRALVGRLAAGGDVVGPRFTWDTAGRMLLPPSEPRGRLVELLYTLGRGGRASGLARRHWRRHARRHWIAQEPVASFALVGALLLFARSAPEMIGWFDEGYRLYFEETDWLARARTAGLRSWFVPEAVAVHLFDQSARGEPRSGSWFAESSERFRRRHYGRAWSLLLGRLEGLSLRARRDPAPRPWPPRAGELSPGEYWVEVSPHVHGYPAAAERWAGDPAEWRLPVEIRERHPELGLYVHLLDAGGRERGWFSLPAAATGGAR